MGRKNKTSLKQVPQRIKNKGSRRIPAVQAKAAKQKETERKAHG